MHLETNINIGFLGISERDVIKFTKIFQIIRPNKRSYRVENNIDAQNVKIMIVNTDSSPANEQFELFRSKNPTVALVTIGSNQSPHHISGMLLPSRVYKVMDEVALAPIETKTHPPSPTTSGVAQNRFQQPVAHPITPKVTELEPKVAEPEVVAPIITATPKPVSPKVSPEVTQEPEYQVLVVDDSELMQKAVLVELEKVDRLLKIDFASSGEEGMQRIEEKTYDVIFMDVMMPKPGMDGFEACTKIRKIPEMKKTPIIMLTAKTSPLDEVKGVMAGCTTYLTKPIKQDNFQAVMKRVLGWLEKFHNKNEDSSHSASDKS